MKTQNGEVSEERALLDNILDMPLEEFASVRHDAMLEAHRSVEKLLTPVELAYFMTEEAIGSGERAAKVGAIYSSLVMEILGLSMTHLLKNHVGRATAIRFIRDCWVKKSVEVLRAEFPELRIDILVRDGEPGVPPVPPAPDGN